MNRPNRQRDHVNAVVAITVGFVVMIIGLVVITSISGVVAGPGLPTETGHVEQNHVDPNRLYESDRTSAKLSATIKLEIKTLGDHDWAGEYYHGDGLGENVSLLIAPKSGYVFEWHGCLGLYDRNFGKVVSLQDRLRLSFTFENKREGFQGIAEEFIPVSWGDRKYLIPSDDVVGFCNEVNSGSEPRSGVYGLYLMRTEDVEQKVTGFPILPPRFQRYLLASPIEGEIIKVGNSTTRPSLAEWKFKDTTVTLNIGKRDGILSGMELHVVEPDDIVKSVKIQRVEDERSEGVMVQIGEEAEGPRVGWKLSTRAPWNTH